MPAPFRALARLIETQPPAALRILAALVFAVMAFPSHAQTGDEIDTLLDAAGIENIFAGMQERAVAMTAAIPGIPSDYVAAWEAAAGAAFAPEIMMADARPIMARELNTEAITEMIAFRTSPLGRSVTQAEGVISRLDGEALQALRIETESLDIAEDRHALFERIADLTYPGNVEGPTSDLIAAMMLPLYGQEATDAYLDEVAPILQTGYRDFWHLQTALTYASLTDADLSAFLAVLETPAARAYTDAYGQALIGSYRMAIERTAAGFAP